MYRAIEIKIEQIIKQFNINTAPVPVEEIIEKLGIRVKFAPSSEYSGMLIKREDGLTLMGINSLEAQGRQKFTMAHELAHYFILKKKSGISIDYRSNTKKEYKEPDEKWADYFAANLLMPKSLLKEDYLKVRKDSKEPFSEKELVGLADKYQVSKEAMTFRLINLNLV